MPLHTLFENLEAGATVEEFLDWYPEVKESQVMAALKRQAKSAERNIGNVNHACLPRSG